MTRDTTPINPDNSDSPASLTSSDIALIRAYASGCRVHRLADPTTEPYDAAALERAVEEIAAEHDMTVEDLITAVYGCGEKAVADRVRHSYRRHMAVAGKLEEVILLAQWTPADLAVAMYGHGLARRLIPCEHDQQAIHARLATVAETWTDPEIATVLRLLAGSDEYVVMRLREDGEAADLVQVPVADPGACDHGMTVCTEMDCVGSWSTDWQIIESQSNIDRRMRYVIHESALPPIG